MTIFLADYAVYQAGLTLAELKAAGYTIINFKTSHGLTQKSVAANVPGLLAEARRLGLAISSFHWLDNSASGTAQADYAFTCLTNFGLTGTGFAHVCDCESNATEKIFRDYMTRMQSRLGRKIGLYTGDWWWTDPSRRWTGAGLTPYLHAAPNQGYLAAYPGDTSTHWKAGYGGWPNLSIMQHRVAKVAGVAVSQSAIRDPAVWAALTGGEDDEMTPADWERLEDIIEREINQAYQTNWWGAYHAVQNDAAFQAADAATQKAWRNLATVFRKTIGDPVSEQKIIEAVSAADPVRDQAVADLAAIRADLAARPGDGTDAEGVDLAPVLARLDELTGRLAAGGSALRGDT